MTKRIGMALHWRIMIGLVLGVVVGIALNIAWSRYTWGALGVGDSPAFLAASDGERLDEGPRDMTPAVRWLAGALEEYSVGEGASPLDRPRNAYTARVVDWLVRDLLEDHTAHAPGGDEGAGDEAGGDRPDAVVFSATEPPPLPEGADLQRARDWLRAIAMSDLALLEDPDREADPDPVARPDDEVLSASLAWLLWRVEQTDPNEHAGIVAWVPRFVSNLNNFVGSLFIRSLRFIAIPLVLFSLIVGASSLNDLRKLSRIGGKTIGLYLATTALAITIGLVLANIVKPGEFVPEEVRELLASQNSQLASDKLAQAGARSTTWDTILNIVPQNPFAALAEAKMLQVVFFALVIGIGLTLIKREKAAPVVAICDAMTDLVIKIVHVVMKVAPIAVFALIVKVVASMGLDVLVALLVYSLVVIGGLLIMMLVVYPTILRLFSPVGYRRFFKAIAPAQLLAFSSSSSAATLPVTMECAEQRLGVSEEVSSFVLPLGATINMDGTALYQGVAAIFIAQLYGIPIGLGGQLTIILTATLASIGTAAVPSAGLIMLIIVLEQLGFSAEVMAGGLAILFGVDRLLDMCRTSCNVTGDSMVAAIVASSEGELLTEEEVAQRQLKTNQVGLDEHPHKDTGES